MISVSWAMMAHPKRSTQVRDILRALGEKIPVVWDAHNDRWNTGRTAMLKYDESCTHHAVIQDDVLVCRDLIAAMPVILSYVPEDVPLCGYIGKRRPYADRVRYGVKAAEEIGASFITMHTLNWGPLIVVPTAVIKEMIAHCDSLRDIANYDRRLSRYWELVAKKRVWYTWPSVVDHADGPSLVPGRVPTSHDTPHARVAHRFLGEDVSALEWDWSGPVVDANTEYIRAHPELQKQEGVVVFRHKRSGAIRKVQLRNAWKVKKYEAKEGWERIEL